MRLKWFILRCLAVGIPACLLLLLPPRLAGDTVLFNNGDWIVEGGTDPGPDPYEIAVSVNGLPAGMFSELKVYHAYTGAGFPQFWSIKGNGAFRPKLPPPGEFGGTFFLTQYWDCVAGLVRSLVLVELNLQDDGSGSGNLFFTGKLSNLTSLEANDFEIRLLSPNQNSVKADINYTLVATRDFCVNEARQELLDGFQVAQIVSYYISDAENFNDSFRYKSVMGKVCDCCDCWKVRGWVCGQLFNNDTYLNCYEDKLAEERLFLIHSYPYPANTPTLNIHFKKPQFVQFNPQGFVFFSDDPNLDNVFLWGNWRKAKDSYKAGKKIGKFQLTLEAESPDVRNCDAGACFY